MLPLLSHSLPTRRTSGLFGLEGLPDDRRLGIGARPGAIDAPARLAIDTHHAHALWRGEGDRLAIGERGVREILEDRRGIAAALRIEIGRAHVRTPVTNAHLVCRLQLEKTNSQHAN